MNPHHSQVPYVLISPARNGEKKIEKTIQSMINQTHLSLKWVIVNDGSTDSTASIINRYIPKCGWIEMIERPTRRDRSFAAKVNSFNAGFERVKYLNYDLIGNLDADLSFEKDYLESLKGKFAEESSSGVAGTIFRKKEATAPILTASRAKRMWLRVPTLSPNVL